MTEKGLLVNGVGRLSLCLIYAAEISVHSLWRLRPHEADRGTVDWSKRPAKASVLSVSYRGFHVSAASRRATRIRRNIRSLSEEWGRLLLEVTAAIMMKEHASRSSARLIDAFILTAELGGSVRLWPSG